jgi:cysteine desulfurase
MTPRDVYADHASTTRPLAGAVEAMSPWLGDRFGNASSVHTRGVRAREAVEDARARVAALIGARPEEIVFTASGSESNNLALRGLLDLAPPGRRRVVVSAIEHASVLVCVRHLESQGVPLTVLPVTRGGVVELADVERALGPDVALISLMAVNNEVGTIQPVREAAALARGAGAIVHCDAAQAVGKMPVDVGALGADLLTLAGHKFGGPPGGAALFVRRRTRLSPLVHGGHHERGRRAGTEDVPAIVGLGFAAAHARALLATPEGDRAARAGARLRDGLLARVPGARLNGDRDRVLSSIVNLCFPGVDGEAVLHELDREGIIVSTGSACSASDTGPSHVLVAMGASPEEAHASVRFSLGPATEDADVDWILERTPAVVERLRALAGPASRRSA